MKRSRWFDGRRFRVSLLDEHRQKRKRRPVGAPPIQFRAYACELAVPQPPTAHLCQGRIRLARLVLRWPHLPRLSGFERITFPPSGQSRGAQSPGKCPATPTVGRRSRLADSKPLAANPVAPRERAPRNMSSTAGTGHARGRTTPSSARLFARFAPAGSASGTIFTVILCLRKPAGVVPCPKPRKPGAERPFASTAPRAHAAKRRDDSLPGWGIRGFGRQTAISL